MDSNLEQQIRFADALGSSYFATLTRLRESARRGVTGKVVYLEETLQSAVGEAASTVEDFLDATRTARDTAKSLGLEPGTSFEPFEAPALEEESEFIRLDEALQARAELRGLQNNFPEVNWADSLSDVDTDLFSSKRKNLYIMAGSAVAVGGVLAVFYPMGAFIFGMLAVMLLGKPVLQEIIWRKS